MRVVVAMSGGVDSSVAALELKKKGNEVIGLTIKTWPKEACGSVEGKMCCSLDAIQYARSAAEDIDIPHYVVDLSKEFTLLVKDYFVKEYAGGRTPNPCVYCNSKIKFGYLLRKAQELNAEKIATGHYAHVINKGNMVCLAEGEDKKKDQSYFLYNISKDVLPLIDFPLGGYSKDDVCSKAEEAGFMPAYRRSSQDICFKTEGGDYKDYIRKENKKIFSPGDILDKTGKVLGRHEGIAAYTIGQRHGLGLGWHEPVYVTKIDPEKNTVTVGEKSHAEHKKIRVKGFNWLTIDRLDAPCEFLTRIRYNSEKVKALVSPDGEDEAIVEFDTPQFAPTPGQAAVFYEDEIVAGGAWIEEIIE